MLIEAYNLMLSIEPAILPEVLRIFNRCALEVCEGQQLDMNFEELKTVSVDEYMEMIRLKTSVLLGFALQMGALIGGAPSQEALKLCEFGVCVGLGFSMALACDMLITSENANFSQIFTRIGLSSDGGGSYFLTKLLGHRKAFELIASNKNITAQEALALGITSEVLPNEKIEEAVSALAENLVNGPLVAIEQVKANIRIAETGTLAEALQAEAENQGKCFRTFDFMEGQKLKIKKSKGVAIEGHSYKLDF